MNIRVFPLITHKPEYRAFSILIGQDKVNVIDKQSGNKSLALLEELIDLDVSMERHLYYTFYFEAPINVFPELATFGFILEGKNVGFMVHGLITGTKQQFEVTRCESKELKTLFSLIISNFQTKAII